MSDDVLSVKSLDMSTFALFSKEKNVTHYSTDDLNNFARELLRRVFESAPGSSRDTQVAIKTLAERAFNHSITVGYYDASHLNEEESLQTHASLDEAQFNMCGIFVKHASELDGWTTNSPDLLQIARRKNIFADFTDALALAEVDENTNESYCALPPWVARDLAIRLCAVFNYLSNHMMRTRTILGITSLSSRVNRIDKFYLDAISALPKIRILPRPEGKAEAGGITYNKYLSNAERRVRNTSFKAHKHASSVRTSLELLERKLASVAPDSEQHRTVKLYLRQINEVLDNLINVSAIYLKS